MNKIALVGCGYWGTIIAKTLNNIGFKKILVLDKDSSKSKILKKRFKNINIENNFNKILKNSKIKLIFFATPPSESYRLVKKALF